METVFTQRRGMTLPEDKEADTRLPSTEEVQQELSKAKSIDDFFGKDGIFAKLFAKTLEEMLKG